MKWEAAKKYCDAIKKDALEPLDSLYQEQSKYLRAVDTKWKLNNKIYEEKRMLVDAARSKYHKLVAKVDDGLVEYTKARTGKDLNPDKKNRLIHKMNGSLTDAKEAEKTYKLSIYTAKDSRSQHIEALVSRSIAEYTGFSTRVLSTGRRSTFSPAPDYHAQLLPP